MDDAASRSQSKVDEFARLLGIYVHAAQSMQGREFSGSEAWVVEAEHLALKLVYHLASLLYLRPGTRLSISGTEMHFFDFPSAAVLCRSAFETYLTFSYIFISPCSDDERQLRHLVWNLGGLFDRQRSAPETDEACAVLTGERQQIQDLLKEIGRNDAFLALPPKRQKEARRGQWRFDKGWADLADMAGKNKKYFASLYAYLSSHTHSGYLSAMQIGQADDKQTQSALCEPYIGIGLTLLSHFLTDYGTLFPPVAEAIERNPDDKRLVDLWQAVGDNMGELYPDVDGSDGSA